MNPITQARTRAGMSRRELAIAADVSYAEVAKAETGYTKRLNRSLAFYLQAHGLVVRPEVEYREWRERAMAAAGGEEATR